MDPALTRWVNAVASAERDLIENHDLSLERARFLACAGRQRRNQGLLRAVLGVAAVAVLGAACLILLRGSSALEYSIDGVPANPGEVLTAPAERAVSIQFSDGSRVSLLGNGTSRVVELSRVGARVRLERGSLDARVMHTSNARWDFEAGPFRVRVIGTSFSLRWDPTAQRFALELRAGAVELLGPKLDPQCVLRAGQTVEVDLREAKVTGACFSPKVSTPVDAPLTQAARRLEAAPVTPRLPAPSTEKRQRALVPPKPPIFGWRQLAVAGKQQAAWQAVTSASFESVQRAASASDLIALADLARFSGAPDRAVQALLELRKRFAGTPEANRSAFLLGRVAVDQQGALLDGARWFATYLKEQPRGSFAEEASGRLLDCYARAGAREEAAIAAERYLELYPAGAYRTLAVRIFEAQRSGATR